MSTIDHWTFTSIRGARGIMAVAVAALLVACGNAANTSAPVGTPTVLMEPMVPPVATSTPESTNTTEPTATPPATETAPPAPTMTEAATTPTTETDASVVPSNVVTDEALRLVAEHSGIAEEELKVLSVEEVTWSSSAIGCPQPDRAYLDRIVPGIRVIVEGQGQTYYVHGGEAGSLFVCDTPEEPVPGERGNPDVSTGEVALAPISSATPIPTIAPSATPLPTLAPTHTLVTLLPTATFVPPTPTTGVPTMSIPTNTPPSGDANSLPANPYARRAIELVSEYSGITPENLTVVSMEEVQWRDSSLGCPKPGSMYMQVITPGTRIIVEGEGQTFSVHGRSLENLFVCDRPQPPYQSR